MPDIKTYHAHQEPEAGLQWTRTRLLFHAYITFGPMHGGTNDYRIGPSACGRYDVLWLEGEEMEDPHRLAIAWVEKGTMKGMELWQALIRATWFADRYHWEYPRPCMEIWTKPSALMQADAVRRILDEVWHPE